MKIAIFSDSHDNLATLGHALGWANREKIETIVHCGDLTNAETREEISKLFSGPIHLVLGNADDRKLASEKNFKVWGEVGKITFNGKKIAFTHFPEKALELAKKDTFDLVFYGHTHKPWEEKIGNCRLINPGNLAGIIYKATFAVYDTSTDKLELKILERI